VNVYWSTVHPVECSVFSCVHARTLSQIRVEADLQQDDRKVTCRRMGKLTKKCA
jgi:hypothetical protein